MDALGLRTRHGIGEGVTVVKDVAVARAGWTPGDGGGEVPGTERRKLDGIILIASS
jgi:hypothetical protein